MTSAMSAKKYNNSAKCVADGCRFAAVGNFDGSCGHPTCREQVKKFNPVLIQKFKKALDINPKSEVSKSYREAIMKGFANQQKNADLKAMQEAAKIISAQEQIDNAALAEALNDAQVSTPFPFHRSSSKISSRLSKFVFPCLSSFLNLSPSFLLYAVP